MTQLTQAQKRVALDAIAASDPTLADAIAERLDEDPTAAAIDRMSTQMMSELRAFRWQILGLVGLAMVLNTALVGIGVVGRYGDVELEVTPAPVAPVPSSTVPAPVVRPDPLPAPLSGPRLW